VNISIQTPASRALLSALLRGLVAANLVILKRNPRLPSLYESGVRYAREPRGDECWKTYDQVLRAGRGDCEDLAAARSAELIKVGVMAWPEVIRTGRKRFHAVVRLPDGSIEDPSLKLGMQPPQRRRRRA